MKTLRLTFTLFFSMVLVSCGEEKTKDTAETASVEVIENQDLDFIFPKGNQGPAELFTGNAFNYGLVANDSIYNTVVGNVYFEPGARSNWHTHPGGQILIITDGVGYHQIEGQPIEVIKKGDVVQCPPDTRHWHGASPDQGMQQLYIVTNTDKGIVNWMEAVTEAQYNNI